MDVAESKKIRMLLVLEVKNSMRAISTKVPEDSINVESIDKSDADDSGKDSGLK